MGLVNEVVKDKQRLGDLLHMLAVAMRRQAMQTSRDSVGGDVVSPEKLRLVSMAVENASTIIRK